MKVLDIHKKGRDFENMTLSDRNVIKYLILYRSQVDLTYNACTNINIFLAGDTFEFNTELIVLYASLDTTIELCNFKSKQTKLLELLFSGHTILDICAMKIGYKKSATYDLLDRMITRIVNMNYNQWKATVNKS